MYSAMSRNVPNMTSLDMLLLKTAVPAVLVDLGALKVSAVLEVSAEAVEHNNNAVTVVRTCVSSFGGGGMEDIFDMFFGGQGRGSRGSNAGPQRGADLRFDLEITFEEAAFGLEREISLYRDEQCPHCHGNGAEPGSKVETCPECHGSGEIRFTQNTMFGQMTNVRPCPKCHGEGKIISEPCKECRGQGTVKKNKKLKVKIPAGVDNGSRLRVAGEGEAGVKGGPSGDLYVYLYVKPHKFFERDGTTVYCEVPINIVQATLGDEIKVPTLDGQVVMKVPEGTQPGKVLRLKGKGIPSLRNSTRGDQLVRIKVVVPQKLNEKQKDALRKFAEISKDNINPEEKGFLNKIKDIISKLKNSNMLFVNLPISLNITLILKKKSFVIILKIYLNNDLYKLLFEHRSLFFYAKKYDIM